MKRLFFGLELDAAARDALSAFASVWRSAEDGRWTSPENYHVTLAFLGMTDEARLPQLCAFADSAFESPFELTIARCGSFKNGAILWAGVCESAPLAALRARLFHALTENGYPVERDYTPHVTLARGAHMKASPPDYPPVRLTVDHATLFESVRVEGALSYVPIHRSASHG